MSQRVQALRRDRAESTPSPFEFIEFGKESEQFLSDLDGGGVHHTREYAGLYRIVHRESCRIRPVYPELLRLNGKKSG
jgi:hypothetical protein